MCIDEAPLEARYLLKTVCVQIGYCCHQRVLIAYIKKNRVFRSVPQSCLPCATLLYGVAVFLKFQNLVLAGAWQP